MLIWRIQRVPLHVMRVQKSIFSCWTRAKHLDDLAEGGEHGDAAGVAAADAAVRVPQAQLQHRRVHRTAQLRVRQRALYRHPLRHRNWSISTMSGCGAEWAAGCADDSYDMLNIFLLILTSRNTEQAAASKDVDAVPGNAQFRKLFSRSHMSPYAAAGGRRALSTSRPLERLPAQRFWLPCQPGARPVSAVWSPSPGAPPLTPRPAPDSPTRRSGFVTLFRRRLTMRPSNALFN